MIKVVRSRLDGTGKLLVLGLTWEDLDSLRDGKGVLLDGPALGVDTDVMLLPGETHEDVIRLFVDGGLVTPEHGTALHAAVVEADQVPGHTATGRVFKVEPDGGA